MFQLFWNRFYVIKGFPAVTAICLFTGCAMFEPIFMPKPTASQALDIVSTAVETTNLWWAVTFAGFLALLAGIVNLVFLRGGAKLLVIGIILAMIPPIVDSIMAELAPWVSILIGLLGLGLLGLVFGRWFGRKDIMKRINLREDFIRNTKTTKLNNNEVADVLKHVGDTDFNPQYKVK